MPDSGSPIDPAKHAPGLCGYVVDVDDDDDSYGAVNCKLQRLSVPAIPAMLCRVNVAATSSTSTIMATAPPIATKQRSVHWSMCTVLCCRLLFTLCGNLCLPQCGSTGCNGNDTSVVTAVIAAAVLFCAGVAWLKTEQEKRSDSSSAALRSMRSLRIAQGGARW